MIGSLAITVLPFNLLTVQTLMNVQKVVITALQLRTVETTTEVLSVRAKKAISFPKFLLVLVS